MISQKLVEVMADLSSAPLEPTPGRVSTVTVSISSVFPLWNTGTTTRVRILRSLAGRLHLALTESEGEVAGVAPVLVGLGGTPVCLGIVGVVAVSEGIP